jgi:Co/Zn/Cd efflux system component
MTHVTRDDHVFLGEGHEKKERRTWMVVALCSFMMVAEIIGGLLFGSIALVADGLHMSTLVDRARISLRTALCE